jgi:ribulose-phosphate 3-epimerase
METIIAPSVLSADFSKLGSEIEMINNSEAQWIHIDIMDGMFVPNITFGPAILRTIRKHTDRILDVHLMIEKPERFLKDFKTAGADIITVHYEASTHLHRTIQEIKKMGIKAGVSVNPHTNVHLLKDILEYVDLVLVMSVNPGFGGQEFIPSTYNKLRELSSLMEGMNNRPYIEVDGGVNINNARDLVNSGANVLVAGNAIFKSEDPAGYISSLVSVTPDIR